MYVCICMYVFIYIYVYIHAYITSESIAYSLDYNGMSHRIIQRIIVMGASKHSRAAGEGSPQAVVCVPS